MAVASRSRFAGSFSQPLAPEGWGSGTHTAPLCARRAPTHSRLGSPSSPDFSNRIQALYNALNQDIELIVIQLEGTDDAQQIFDRFKYSDLEVTILKFEHTAWCNACEGMVSPKTCPHGDDQKVSLSGTKVRDMLRAGERPPMEFSRPEVADVLIKWAQAVG